MFCSLAPPGFLLGKALDVAHGQALCDDALGHRIGIGDGEQGAGMAGADRALGEHLAGLSRQLQEPQGVVTWLRLLPITLARSAWI